jgi:hypothetical protein
LIANKERRERREEKSREASIACDGHKTVSRPAVRIVRQLLTFVKKFGWHFVLKIQAQPQFRGFAVSRMDA